MLDVPEHFHEHRITKLLHDTAHSVTDKRALSRFSSSMDAIHKKFDNIKKFMDVLPSSTAMQASSFEGIEKSYHDLSRNLRSCLLYFCNFPANYHVKRGRLVRLWIAERFMEERRSKTKEDIADGYLNELIERNLVDVHGIKRCQVSPPLRDFILDKSEMIRFCTVLPRLNGINSIEESRRLSLHNLSTNLLLQKDLSCTRTLMTFGRDAEFKAEDLLSKFRLLRVLDLRIQACNLFRRGCQPHTSKVFENIKTIPRCIKTIPRCIKKLHSLEVLDVVPV